MQKLGTSLRAWSAQVALAGSKCLGKYCARIAVLLAFSAAASRASAIILYDTGDTTRNTTAPTGTLAGSGWELQGSWGSFLGTPISPNYFVAAKHVGGSVGSSLTYNGLTYTAVSSTQSGTSDLTLWKVSTPFSTYAKLYTGTQETTVSDRMMVYGRGTQRGAEVRDVATNTLKGWQWGSADHVERWGQNNASAVSNFGGSIGEVLSFAFNANGGANEAHLSSGDSSGGVFIKDPTDGAWKLAGINYAVDNYFNTTNTGSGFSGAIFDKGGLYYGSSSSWSPVTESPVDKPSSWYATRISSNAAWLNSITNYWSPTAGGNWSQASNWSAAAAPNAEGAFATLSGTTGGSRAVTINTSVQLGSLDLLGSTSQNLGGTNTLTFSVANGNAALNVSGGAHTISAPVVLADDLAVTVASGSLTTSGAITGTGKILTKTGDGTLNVAGNVTAGLTLQQGVTNISANTISGALRISGNATTANITASTLTVNSLDLDGGVVNTKSLTTAGNLTVSAPTALTLTSTTPGTYVTLGGTGSKSFNSDLNISGSGTVTLARSAGTVSVTPGANITLAGNAQLLLSGVLPTTDSGNARVNVVNNSTLSSGLSVMGTGQSVGAITGNGKTTVSGTANITADSIQQDTLQINGGAFKLRTGSSKISVVKTLNIAGLPTSPTATLDLGDGVLFVDYSGNSPLSTFCSLIHSGSFNPTGTGIKTSAGLISGELLGVAVAEASDLGLTLFSDPQSGSITLDSTCLILKTTYLGDADFDGDVDTDDLGAWSANVGRQTGASTPMGDFDSDGDVDTDDLGAWSATWGAGVSMKRSIATSPQPVPEPSSFVLAGIAMTGLAGWLMRRRRAA